MSPPPSSLPTLNTHHVSALPAAGIFSYKFLTLQHFHPKYGKDASARPKDLFLLNYHTVITLKMNFSFNSHGNVTKKVLCKSKCSLG